MDEKIKVFGLGRCGVNIVSKVGNNKRLSKILICSCVCCLDIASLRFDHKKQEFDKNGRVDISILCGPKSRKGLGCEGNPKIGYKAAHETFKNIFYTTFYKNDINLLVAGLGGGMGTGCITYLLEKMYKKKKDRIDYLNKIEKRYNDKTYKNIPDETYCLNIVLCTFPFNIERKRVITTANHALKKLSKYADIVVLFDMGKLKEYPYLKNGRFQKSFEIINKLIISFILQISKLSNSEIRKAVEIYTKKGNIIRIEGKNNLKKYFGLIEK